MYVYTRHVHLSKAVVLISLGAAGCHSRNMRPELAVAAAANLSEAAPALGSAFEAGTGIHPVFSFASTAQLCTQIENQAPFDVLLAADEEHIARLERERLLVPGSRAVYAIGILALWIPPGSRAHVERVDDLVKPEVRVIGIAKPELAPYGQAAAETLEHAGIWDQVKSRIVYAENISQAKQYGASGNADAVFTAYALVRSESGKVIEIDPALHRPIVQAMGMIAASAHQEDARKFSDFLLNGKGREILSSYGYRLPRNQEPRRTAMAQTASIRSIGNAARRIRSSESSIRGVRSASASRSFSSVFRRM